MMLKINEKNMNVEEKKEMFIRLSNMIDDDDNSYNVFISPTYSQRCSIAYQYNVLVKRECHIFQENVFSLFKLNDAMYAYREGDIDIYIPRDASISGDEERLRLHCYYTSQNNESGYIQGDPTKGDDFFLVDIESLDDNDFDKITYNYDFEKITHEYHRLLSIHDIHHMIHSKLKIK